VSNRFPFVVFSLVLFLGAQAAIPQGEGLHGQASGWIAFDPEKSPVSQTGLRYIPELFIEKKLDREIGLSIDISLNGFVTADFQENQSDRYEEKIKPYRFWLRFSTNTFETRVGLQKINFGSAVLFRPLMWFDRMDPRDPLQLTDGVWGLLIRRYFLNNANIWLWALYGEDGTKGWETAPTKKNSVEYGGRIQTPFWIGEAGLSFHHREAGPDGIESVLPSAREAFTPENRIGLDGKWDIGAGVWFEGVLVSREHPHPGKRYQRLWTLGADYTFKAGSGLTAAMEYFRIESPDRPFASAGGVVLSAFTLNYPLGILNRLSGILYRDWTNNEWYRLLSWQRTYNRWSLHLLGFWNPDNARLYQDPSGSHFDGVGLLFMAVFNH